jgi:hypothetical protein
MNWRAVLSLFSAFAIVAAGAPTGEPMFRVSTPRGITFTLQNSPTPQKYLIETMPGGVALLDYNKDGLLDIFLVNAGHIAPGRAKLDSFDRANPTYWNRLYRQNKDGSFTDVTEQAGLAKAGDANFGMGVAVGDYDNDGYPDLYVTSYGKNVLYHNNGDGTFTDVTEKAGVAAGGWSTSAGFFDYDNDGKLDLLVTRYLDWTMAKSKVCGAQQPTYCPPEDFGATTSILYHNRGDGTFEDVSVKSGIASVKGHGLGLAFADYDGDGFTDVYIANDVTRQFLFHNNGDGTFREVGVDSGSALTVDGDMISGMGVVFQDYDNDGRPDLVITELPRQPYVAFHNDGRGLFSDQSLEAGFGTLSGAVSGWGVGLEDFDNDGWKDLFVAQGHVFDNVQSYDGGLRYLEPPLFALNRAGRFEKADAGTSEPMSGRGAAFGDTNNDGWMDVIVTRLGGTPLLFENRSASAAKSHWLGIQLEGVKSNRDGLGARVDVNGQTRFAATSGSYLSASDPRLHFGLGDKSHADVEIHWPSGVHQKLSLDAVDRYVAVKEGTNP